MRIFSTVLYPKVLPGLLGLCLLGGCVAATGCSGGGGSSAPAPVTVAPAITTQPAAQSLFVGDTATFSVAASGTAPLSYQWLRGGTAVAGATSASYTTGALVATDDGALFSVAVSNSAGSVTSGTATLSVALHAPAITTQPAAQSVFVGDSAVFSVVATGTAPLTYDWRKNGTTLGAGSSATYTTPVLAASDSGAVYTVVVSNGAGSVTSASAALTVALHPPAITTQPAAVTVTEGATASFSVVATGTAPLTYQWLRGATAISGATASSYALTNAQLSDSGAVYTAVVSNGAGTATSAPAALTVTAAPIVITAQPAGATQFAGETATFLVRATGTAPTYQWRKNGAAITGATAATYTTPALTAADDKATFDVVVSNTKNSLASAAATLRVGPFATVFTTQKGVVLNLYAWPGAKYAFLTKTAALNPVTIRQILNAADGTWNYYAATVGKLPGFFVTYNGLATIANTGVGGVDLCGDGCTYIGATGMEISDRITANLLNNVPTTYDWVLFYETGRSFWLFQNQLEYKSPNTSACEVTGFAVFMGIHSIQAQNLPSDYGTSIPNNPNPFANELLALDSYTANPALNFQNTFLTSTFSSPYGDCPVLWTGLVYRLSQNYGGEAFIQALFKEALKRPNAVTTQDAVDNFVLAASAAANHNLTQVFISQWKWPVSVSASNEAQSKYGAP